MTIADGVLGVVGILRPLDSRGSCAHHFHPRWNEHHLVCTLRLVFLSGTADTLNYLLSSMEYIICQAESKGALIVSEFTGVSATLSKAVKVNPWDLGVSTIRGRILVVY